MATVQVAVVNRSLRLIGKLAGGRSPATAESDDCLVALNAMIDAWRNEGLMCVANQHLTLPLSNADSSYTIGPTGDLVTVRPISIKKAWIEYSGQSYPVEVITDQRYARIVTKAQSGDWPDVLNYKATMPNGTVTVYPVPNASRTLKLLVDVPLSALALSDTLAVPPGWEDALAHNLAVRVAPEFEVSAPDDVKRAARDTKAYIKKVNMRPLRHRSQVSDMVGGRSHRNILADTP